MRYPREVYSIREDVTRENMRQYDLKMKRLYARCEEIEPNYWKLGLREQMEIRKRAEAEISEI